MIACPECGGRMQARANPVFMACRDCGKLIVVSAEAKQEMAKSQERATTPAPVELEIESAVTGDIVVPDFTDVMVGWRAWKVVERPGFLPQLRSATKSAIWPGYEVFAAECNKHKNKPSHQIPTFKCQCGVYSAKSRAHLLTMGYNNYYDPDEALTVIGEVNLWGHIVEGTQGWRAQFGYPRKLYVPFEAAVRILEPLEQAYGVPVKLQNTLKQEAS